MLERLQVFATVFVLSAAAGAGLAHLETSQDRMVYADNINLADNSLVIGTDCYQLDMLISDGQEERLQRSLTDTETERPEAYQVLGEVEASTTLEFDRVEIHSLKNGSYRADLVVEGLRERRIDLRPSDGVLVASERDLPVYLDRGLLEEEARNLCLDRSVEI